MTHETTESLTDAERDALDLREMRWFDSTGVPAIDRMFAALEAASDLFHDSTMWGETCDYGYGPIQSGSSPEELIQRAANEAAEEIRSLATWAQQGGER